MDIEKNGQQSEKQKKLTISNKQPYRFMTLEELSNPDLKGKERFPVRVLGRLESFIEMKDLPGLFQTIKEEKGMSGLVFYHDLQHKQFLKAPDTKGADSLRKAILGMDDLNLLVDLKQTPSHYKLNQRELMFLSGYIMMEMGEFPCLVVECVTEAKDLNLELYEKMSFLLKEMIIGNDKEVLVC